MSVEPGGGAIDDQIELLTLEFVQAAPDHRPISRRGRGQRQRLRGGTVRDHQTRRTLPQQRPQHPAYRPARTEHQDTRAGECEQVITGKIANQAYAVGVVAVQTLFAHHQGVHRAGILGACAEDIRQPECALLERQCDVQTTSTRCDELLDVVFEFLQIAQNPLVAHVLPGLPGERRVDLRRFGVFDRIADHGIQVGHAVSYPAAAR